jgi:hypothetical protein
LVTRTEPSIGYASKERPSVEQMIANDPTEAVRAASGVEHLFDPQVEQRVRGIPPAAAVFEADEGADGVAVGCAALEAEADGAVSVGDVVAVKHGSATVGGEEEIDVAVAVEVAAGEGAANARSGESGACLRGNIAEEVVAVVDEEVRRLGVLDIAADVANGVVDVAAGNDEVG